MEIAAIEAIALQAHVSDAIARVRKAVQVADVRGNSHGPSDPCEKQHAAQDAVVHDALVESENAMLDVLSSLPSLPQEIGPLAN